MSRPDFLSLDRVSVHYGGVVAVDQVSLDISEGSFVGLIGPNGAGKTTLIDAICGFCPSTGNISFAGRRLDGAMAFRRARSGLARTFQAGELFDDLSVIDNILVGYHHGRILSSLGEILRCRSTPATARVLDILETFGLSSDMHRMTQDLPVGSRKLVAVARALAGNPTMILLDEPAAGLDQTESKELGRILSRLTDQGVTVVLVDHDVDLVLGICDVIHVLDQGQVIASGNGADIRADPRVVEAYLGSATLDQTA